MTTQFLDHLIHGSVEIGVGERTKEGFIATFEHQIKVDPGEKRAFRAHELPPPTAQTVPNDRVSHVGRDGPTTAQVATIRGLEIHQQPLIHVETATPLLETEEIRPAGEGMGTTFIFHPSSRSNRRGPWRGGEK